MTVEPVTERLRRLARAIGWTGRDERAVALLHRARDVYRDASLSWRSQFVHEQEMRALLACEQAHAERTL